MADVFTESSSQSWGGRIGQSFSGALFGFIIFVIAFPLLFWNEGRAIREAKKLDEGTKSVVSVAADKVDSANQGKLIHLTGDAKTDAQLSDRMFGINVNAIALKRDVQMYQWKESKHTDTRNKIGGGTETVTTYSYDRVWDTNHIDSTSFHMHKDTTGTESYINPTTWPYDGKTQFADNVTLGAFNLPGNLIRMIAPTETLPPVTTPGSAALFKVIDTTYYVGATPDQPKIGDLKITFMAARPQSVSVIAQQSGNTLVPYLTKVGLPISMLQVGAHTADEMFAEAKAANATLTWILRLVGFIMMAFGIALILRPLSVLSGVLPIFEDLANMATGLVAFLGAVVLSLITIAIGWLMYRPLVGGLLLAGALAGIFLLHRARRSPRTA